jgi:protein-tyrosine phosphatase
VAIRSDNLASLTPAGRQAMIEYGVTTVIDLRSESEVRGTPSPPFTEFQVVPQPGSWKDARRAPSYVNIALVDDAMAPVLSRAPVMSQRYQLMLDRRQAALGAIFEAISVAEGPVLFHCFAGKDRTGLVAAMLLSLAGVDPDVIGADYAATDVQLATRYEEWLSKATPERLESMRDELRCPPEWMLAALDHLEQVWGGVASYLEAAGVTPAAIERVVTRLVDSA